MKKRLLILAFVCLAELLAFGSATQNHQVIFSSGSSTTNIKNDFGSKEISVEEVFAGSPATVSVVISGCKVGGTCTTLDTYTTATNATRPASSTISVVYDYFIVTPSWTGGTNVSVTINTTLSYGNFNTGSGTLPTGINTSNGAVSSIDFPNGDGSAKATVTSTVLGNRPYAIPDNGGDSTSDTFRISAPTELDNRNYRTGTSTCGIQEAINACPTTPTNGCTVHVYGACSYSAGITIRSSSGVADGVTLSGQGMNATSLIYTGSGNAITIGGTSYDSSYDGINNISVSCANATCNNIYATRTKHAKIERNLISASSTSAKGVVLDGSATSGAYSAFNSVLYNRFTGDYTTAIDVKGGTSFNESGNNANLISGNEITKTGGTSGTGIDLETGGFNHIQGGDIQGWTTGVHVTGRSNYILAFIESSTTAVNLDNAVFSAAQYNVVLNQGSGPITDTGSGNVKISRTGIVAPSIAAAGSGVGDLQLCGSSSGCLDIKVPASFSNATITLAAPSGAATTMATAATDVHAAATGTPTCVNTGDITTVGCISPTFQKSNRKLIEEFCGGAVAGTTVAYGNLGWVATTSGQVSKLAPVSTNDSCVDEVATTTANPNTQKLCLGACASATTDNMFFNLGNSGTSTPWDSYFRFRVNSTVDGNVLMFAGFMPPATAIYTEALGVMWDNTFSATKFLVVACSGGNGGGVTGCTRTASTISKDGNWHTGRVHSALNGTILFSIDGETDISISTNVPSTNSTAMFLVNNVASSAIKLADADLFMFQQTGLTR